LKRPTNLTIATVIFIPAARLDERSTSTAAGVHALPLRMVESIKRLQPELQTGAFAFEPGHSKILEQRQVPIVTTWTGEGVPPHIPKHPRLAIGAKLF